MDLEGSTNKKDSSRGGMLRSKSTPTVGNNQPPSRGLKIIKKPPNYPVRNQVLYKFGDENYTVGVVTMQGKREDMEDEHDVRLKLGNRPQLGFFGIYDGHSGSLAAEWASKNLAPNFLEKLEIFDQESISNAMLEADKAFLESGIDIMNGTTAVFAISELLQDGWKIIVGNLGDSRCIVGNYSNAEFYCMTTDHKPTDPGETERVMAAGGIVALKRVDGILAVSRSIGDGTYKCTPDLPPEKQKVIPIPDVTERTLTDDNFVFICCDGIFETFTNQQALEFIHERSKTSDDICEVLSELLFAVLEKGSKDNMSAMIIRKKNGVSHNKEPEFIAGEFFPSGTDVYMESYTSNCLRYGVKVEDAKRMWAEKKAIIEKKKVEGLSLQVLREKYMGTDGVVSGALQSVFFGQAGCKQQRKANKK